MSDPTQSRPFWEIIFLSRSERRLRAGWRILLQTIMLGVFLCVISFPVLWVGPGKSQTWLMLFSNLAECFAITVSIIYARRFLDKRTFASLGLKANTHMVADLLAGFIIAFLMMAFIYLLVIGFKWITFEGFAWQKDDLSIAISQSAIWLVIFIIVGWQEEILSRGYQLQNIRDGINLVWGVILSSLIFSVLHIFNPAALWTSMLGIFMAGLFLAFGYLLTGQLWLPIGLHIGWNFFEGTIFGFPVSGLNSYTLLRIRMTGPSLWTGGEFGPEAGLILLPALLFGAGLVYLYSKKFMNRTA
jgi:uncharacterized protein